MGRYDNLEIACLSDALEELDAKNDPDIGDLERVFTELACVLDMLLEADGASSSRNLSLWAREHNGTDELRPSTKEVSCLLDKWDVKDVKELTKKADEYVEIPVGLTFSEAEEALSDYLFKKKEQEEAEKKAKQEKELRKVTDEVKVKKK